MILFYFSGTGNSKYIAELFCREMEIGNHAIYSVPTTPDDTTQKWCLSPIIGFCYPVYFSRAPRIMREFVARNIEVLKNKKLIIFCTQMIFSGDGARSLTDIFPREYRSRLNVIYAEHFFMPNNVTDFFILPVTNAEKQQKFAVRSERKMQKICRDIKSGKIKKRGFNIFSRFLGLFQAVFVPSMEKKANKLLKINSDCNLCGVCVSVCPMKNLVCENEKITHKNNCTICYRCVNKCPKKSITFIFNAKVKKQYEWLAPKPELTKGESK